MSETLPKDRSSELITVDSMASDLHALGVEAGHTLLVHDLYPHSAGSTAVRPLS